MASISTSFLLLLLVLVALSSSNRVTAFAPNRVPTRSSNTRLSESILEAEDRFLQQASQASEAREKPEVVYTIVYNPGTPEEGIHTMKYPRGSENDLLLAFEGMADCIVFARTIKEDPLLDQEPIPTPTSREMIEQACNGMGIQMAFVPMENPTQW